MTWIEWSFAAVIGALLMLLAYSVISTALEIRKKTQPFVDAFSDGLYFLIFRKVVPKRDQAPDSKPEQ